MRLPLLAILGQGKDEAQSSLVFKLSKSRKSRDHLNVNLFLWDNGFAIQLPIPRPTVISRMACDLSGGGRDGLCKAAEGRLSLNLPSVLWILPDLNCRMDELLCFLH